MYCYTKTSYDISLGCLDFDKRRSIVLKYEYVFSFLQKNGVFYLRIFQSQIFVCASPVTTMLVLINCLNYCVASFNFGDSGARDVGPAC